MLAAAPLTRYSKLHAIKSLSVYVLVFLSVSEDKSKDARRYGSG